MAEPAQPQPMSIPTTDIKQEHDLMGLEGIDFSLPPELSSKRPLEEEPVPSTENPEAKRLKAETHQAEDSLEDGLALLVQNALSNVGDLVDQFGPPPDEPPTTEDVMDLDAVSALDLPQPAPTFYQEPLKYIRHAQSQTLINLTFSLLYAFVQHQPVEELMKLMKDGQSEHCKSYRQLRRVFSSSLATFSDNSLVSVTDLDGLDECQGAIDLINLTQFLSWLVDDTTESYLEANTHFFSIFPMQFSELPQGASDALLAIRTQYAIKKLVSKPEGASNAQVLQETLVDGLEEKLRAQHGGTAMTEQETPFVETAKARKASLETDTREQINLVSLREKHQPQMPLQSLSNYVKARLAAHSDLASKFGISIELPPEPIDIESFADSIGDAELDLDDLSSFFEKTASGLVQDALAGLTEQDAGEGTSNQADDKTNGTTKANGKSDFITDYKELEALVAESTSNYVKTTLHGLSPVPYQPTVPASTAESMTAQLPYLAQLQQHQAQHPYYTFSQPPIVEQPPPQPVAGENLPPNQTFPSAILYDKARQAALSKSSAHTRREGLHSTRRPWTQEEEKALMAGLDMVKGPHWSQILTLFGQNGTISDILKDRTQVQLKDKARNLKLFFLKTNSEMPYYLQAVTGELKTRAPTQAARKEAEERARLNSEEDQAKLQGIMALAGGLQHPQHRTGTPNAAGVTSGVLTPAQAASAAQARPGNAAVAPRAVAPAPGQHAGAVQGGVGRPQTGLAPQMQRPQAQQGQQQQQPLQIQMQQGYGQQPQQQQQHQQIRPAQPQGQPGQAGPRPAVQQNGVMGAPPRPAVQAGVAGAMQQQGQAQRQVNTAAVQGAVGMKQPQQQQQQQIQQAPPQQQQQAPQQQQQPQQHQQHVQPQQQQQQQQVQKAPAQPKPAPPKPIEEVPMSQEAAQEAMNAAEAALLEELKAVS